MGLLCGLVLGDEGVQPQDEAVETININKEPMHLTVPMFDDLVVDKESLSVKGSKPWFIKFYAPWCGHCKHLAPIFEDFSEQYKHMINIAQVDCTSDEGRPLCGQFGIRGYPSLYFLKDNMAYQFRERRNVESMAEFIVNEGYLNNKEEHISEIPKRLEGFEKFMKEVKEFFSQLA